MSIFRENMQVMKDAWNGGDMIGDEAQVLGDTVSKIPEVGDFLPDGDDARAAVDSVGLGGGDSGDGGSWGNHLGTIAGGLMGLPLGGAMPMAAALGSKVGGWISDLGDDDHPLVDAAYLGVAQRAAK